MEEIKTKWLMQLLLDAQIFAQELKELSIKNMAHFFCFSIVPQSVSFQNGLEIPWIFSQRRTFAHENRVFRNRKKTKA